MQCNRWQLCLHFTLLPQFEFQCVTCYCDSSGLTTSRKAVGLLLLYFIQTVLQAWELIQTMLQAWDLASEDFCFFLFLPVSLSFTVYLPVCLSLSVLLHARFCCIVLVQMETRDPCVNLFIVYLQG